MFSGIIFLVLVLLTISFSPMAVENGWFLSPYMAFGLGLVVYAIVLGVIIIINRLFKRSLRRQKSLFFIITNLYLLGFLVVYHFILAAHRPFLESSALIGLASISLYLFGIFVFHWSAYPYLSAGSRGVAGSASQYGMTQVRFILPFTVPFLLFSLLVDGGSWLLSENIHRAVIQQPDDIFLTAILYLFSCVFLVGMLIFFPPFMQWVWGCKPLKKSDLKDRLEAICKKAKFKHAGFKTWTILNNSYTAGIIGIVPRFRYIMFTRRVLHDMDQESIEAILAHEIGHSYRKHLIIYPFIILGMIVATALFSSFFSDSINAFFTNQSRLNPSPLWEVFYPLSIFIPYAVIIVLYFRLVFGYFSRLFERQADLHVFELGIPMKQMHHALDELGTLTGNTHHHPSWHHYSIRERMEFLEKAEKDHSLIEKHHRRVKKNLIAYSLILLFSLCYLLLKDYL